jgi:N4-gp56 family major capsid protein
VANAYTDITSGASLGVNLVKTGYERLVAFKLRSEPLFRRVADTRATSLTNPGESVVFNIYDDLADDTTDLSETVNPDSVAIPDTDTVTVTLKEMGVTVIPTLRLRTFTLADIDPAVANIVARNMASSVDTRVQTVLRGGDQVARSDAGAPSTSQALNALTTGDTFKSQIPATLVAKMRGANVLEKMSDNTFAAFVHPDVAYDLRRETGEVGWRYPHNNVAPQNLWLEQVGVFGGVSYVESPRCYTALDGASSKKVYRSYILGQQALAEVVAVEPHLIIGPTVDPMMRFRPLSWHGIAGWSIYRQEALWRVETVSSIDTF